jgi:hypothetical protein
VEFLPAVFHPPRQRPAVQRRDRRVGRPFGGCVVAFAMVGASGNDAAPALLTIAAPSSAAPEPLRNCRRDTMLFTFRIHCRRRLRRGADVDWRGLRAVGAP